LAADCESDFEFEWTSELMHLKDLPIIGMNPPIQIFSSMKLSLSVVPAWPVMQPGRNGKLFVCNVGIPESLYISEGIKYYNIFKEKDIVMLY
jgi:hypothetical protein